MNKNRKMGYRLSFYKIEKKKLDEVADWTDVNFECDDDDRSGYEKLCDNAEQVLFDCTNWLYLTNSTRFAVVDKRIGFGHAFSIIN